MKVGAVIADRMIFYCDAANDAIALRGFRCIAATAVAIGGIAD
jgi:hypothetical protein